MVPALLSEVLSLAVGVSIGLTAEGWTQVLAGCVGWGFVCCFLLPRFIGDAGYEPGAMLFFGSPALTRFIVWWPTAVFVSLTSASVVQFIRA
jgi:hypothetical protein